MTLFNCAYPSRHHHALVGVFRQVLIKGGAPTVEANWGSIVVAQTPADAVEQPKLKLGSDVVLIATA